MRRKGFTLVELLITIGIIALLMGLLMPALAGAREQSRKTKCANNLRALATAVNWYCQDNHGFFPSLGVQPQQPSDWIWWSGQTPDDFKQGALIKYLGTGADPSVFRCPSDEWEEHQSIGAMLRQVYYYSYMMNPFTQIQRWDCCLIGMPCRLSSVRNSSDKILLIDGSSDAVIDGAWVPPPQIGSINDDLADRHDMHHSAVSNDARGNVVFTDTHVEFVTRAFAHDPQHYQP